MSEQHQDIAIKYGTSPKTFGSCVSGLALSLLFTIIAFAIVSGHTLSKTSIFASLAVLAIFQLIAQVVFFLRINGSKDGRWNLLPFIFTILIISVVMGGSLWIMANLNYFMMH